MDEARSAHPLSWTAEEWESWLAAGGAPRYRAKQLFQWMHQKGELDPERMTNLDKGTRARLLEAGMGWPVTVDEVRQSADGTRKLLLKLRDDRLIECVLIPMTQSDDADAAAAAEDDEEDAAPEPKQRVTLCISTQVGCAMGCTFCASGRAGLQRGLVAAEIVAQVLISRRYLGENELLRNLVFMGMGEPLHHYAETARAISLISDPNGIGMSLRRITVSTVGLVPGIRKLGRDFGGKLGLAISLHATDDATRSKMMPINDRYDIAALKQALREYPLPPRRRITIEYTLIRDVNDSVEQAERLVKLLAGLRVKVNLIPMNPVDGSGFQTTVADNVERFRGVLANHRLSCSVRKRRGDEVSAACGQLALRSTHSGLVTLEGARARDPLG
jgi:23S rRNA (adenine2503-C2)-methyltransferase